MKVTIDGKNFKAIVDKIFAVVPKVGAMYMQEVVKISCDSGDDDEGYMNVSNDYRNVAFADILSKAQVKEKGHVYIHRNDLEKIYGIGGTITISSDDHTLTVTNGKKCCEISLANVTDQDMEGYSEEEFDYAFKINQNDLLYALEKTDSARSLDAARLCLTGFYFDGEGSKIVALDGYRMHTATLGEVYFNSFIAPGCTYANLKKIITKNKDTMIRVCISKNRVRFITSDVEDFAFTYEICKMPENYIEYTKLIPPGYKYSFSVNPDEIAEMMKGYAILAKHSGDSHSPVFIVADKRKMCTVQMLEGYKTYDILDKYSCTEFDGKEMYIMAFNMKYLRDAMEIFDGEEIEIKCNSMVSPAYISNEKCSALILPVRSFNTNEVMEFVQKLL